MTYQDVDATCSTELFRGLPVELSILSEGPEVIGTRCWRESSHAGMHFVRAHRLLQIDRFNPPDRISVCAARVLEGGMVLNGYAVEQNESVLCVDNGDWSTTIVGPRADAVLLSVDRKLIEPLCLPNRETLLSDSAVYMVDLASSNHSGWVS